MKSLGLEFSTQSVKVVVLDLDTGEIDYSNGFDYDSFFPEYQTIGGVLPSDHPDVRHTSPLMLLEALDRVFETMTSDHADLPDVTVIKVDGMQHCTVYTNQMFSEALERLDPQRSLVEQLSSCLSRKSCPIWEDRSPVEESRFLSESFKERGGISQLTGNRAELRFPAAQIMRWARLHPEQFEQTARIFLLSAFLTSILAGRTVPVDTGDGWGTNLNHLDIHQPGWDSTVLSTIEQWLKERGISSPLGPKLGWIDHFDAVAGPISFYFVRKYGLNPEATVLIGTGDNPATLLGCGGNMVVSLGSSYTVNGVMLKIEPAPDSEFNIFGYTKGSAMALSVFTNGGKVHDHFYRQYMQSDENAQPNWESYIDKVGGLRLEPVEPLMLPYLFEESVPLRKKGIIRDGFLSEGIDSDIRALHLSQVLSLKRHSQHLGAVDKLCVVGGGARNRVMKQWIADAFNATTYSIQHASVAAPMGCAISGAVFSLGLSYQEAVSQLIKIDPATIHRPIPENVDAMRLLAARYTGLEQGG